MPTAAAATSALHEDVTAFRHYLEAERGNFDFFLGLPEVDPMNFASRVKVPVLMINGRYDFVVPLETCQEPMFRLFGVPDQDKRHVLFDTGHAPPQLPVMKEALNWLDHYLGPVK